MRAAAAALLAMLGMAVSEPGTAEEAVRLYAAGSLRAALSEAATAYSQAYGQPVETVFGASGLLRERIEAGEAAHVLASADLGHPTRLAAAGRAGPVVLFARNSLCALIQPAVATTPDTLLDTLLDPAVKLGTSTPRADPSGDYAFAMFAKAERLRPGAQAALERKALQLTGGPTSEKAPEGRNPYAWVMEQGRADVFLTYCTNAVQARAERPELRQVELPAALAVGAEYGLTVLREAPLGAWRLAMFILGRDGQTILARYGFAAPVLPTEAP